MCGIVGSYAWLCDLGAALDRVAHRGPDGRGQWSEGATAHGHVRLALRDLTPASAQPFIYRNGVLSFVGEIWNFEDLRAELKEAKHIFQTTGDTEVLAAALAEWDVDALPRLEGMFAFAWTRDGRTLLARDRFGKVPLYMTRRGESYLWASERKAFPGRRMLPLDAGQYAELPAGRLVRWYDLPTSATHPDAEGIREMLAAGVRRRLLADAPVCVLISGGLDSGLILALARQGGEVTAYTIRLAGDSQDLRYARQLCAELDVELREVPIPEPSAETAQEAIRCIEINMKAQVEIATLCIPLARQIAADGFKACLSGEAADELFGGYGNMCIQASQTDDSGWRAIRREQVRKMARGNFTRCNKAFMAAGVECRLPYMERPLVEAVLGAGKAVCPPGKGLLKAAARGIVPAAIIKRPKATFQGESGLTRVLARQIHNPVRFYNAEWRRLYG